MILLTLLALYRYRRANSEGVMGLYDWHRLEKPLGPGWNIAWS